MMEKEMGMEKNVQEKNVHDYDYDYVNVLDIANKVEVESCVCGKCGVSYKRVKGSSQAKTVCKKCLYTNKKKSKRLKMDYVIEGKIAKFKTKSGVEFIVNSKDAERVAKYTWYICNGYVQGRVNGKCVFLHRFILGLLDSEDKTLVCDHIDRNKLNNCKSNLRICTQQENSWNKECKGYHKLPNGRYQAYIKVDGKSISLGYYDTEEQARAVRIMAEKELYKEFSSKVDLFNDVEIKRLYNEAMASISIDKYRYKNQNKYRVDADNNLVYVTVTSKGISNEFVINSEDYEKIKDYKWTVATKEQIVARVNGEQQYLARFLLGLPKGDRTKRVKFKDGDKSNYRRNNLEVVECKSKNQESKGCDNNE